MFKNIWLNFPDGSRTVGTCRKDSEISGKRKQHSCGKIFGFFPMISDWFLPEITGSRLEFTGKNPKIFRFDYCFRIPVISGIFL
jgi:hypothetical protein